MNVHCETLIFCAYQVSRFDLYSENGQCCKMCVQKNVAKFNSDNFDNYRKIIYSDLLSSLFLIITKVIKKFKRSNNI